jgi:hypothetical protein
VTQGWPLACYSRLGHTAVVGLSALRKATFCSVWAPAPASMALSRRTYSRPSAVELVAVVWQRRAADWLRLAARARTRLQRQYAQALRSEKEWPPTFRGGVVVGRGPKSPLAPADGQQAAPERALSSRASPAFDATTALGVHPAHRLLLPVGKFLSTCAFVTHGNSARPCQSAGLSHSRHSLRAARRIGYGPRRSGGIHRGRPLLAGTRPMLAPNLKNGAAGPIPAKPRNRGSTP